MSDPDYANRYNKMSEAEKAQEMKNSEPGRTRTGREFDLDKPTNNMIN